MSIESPPIISANGLRKQYDSVLAVDDVSLDVRQAEIFGILGPNGAGKTTTLEMIEGLREPDTGTIVIDGIDSWQDPEEIKRRIGIQLQSTALFEFLSVRELIVLFGSLYSADTSSSWVDQLISLVSLEEKANDYAETLSGGQQQRLSIALALVNDPKIVFLDEPTTGLDPQARRNLWDVVRQIRQQGKTIVLTTHYMEEAEILCDRVAVMDAGRIILCDTPTRLIETLETTASISVESNNGALDATALRKLPATIEVAASNGEATIQTTNLQETMASLIELARDRSIELHNLRTSRPTLEDVFLHYTGRTLRE